MAIGNKGFAGLVVASGEGAVAARRPPRTGFLNARESRLAELAAGSMVTRIHEAVDPALCRIWEGHNRDYAALDEHVCADLLDSLRAQGRQEVPAVVRRVKGNPNFQYEVICGARRHWSVSWLRRHDYPEFKFLIEPRELTDEEAFRVADLENRSRKDLSDYERATDYNRAVARYYEGSQQRMADRLNVTKSWLSRYLELARLPDEVLLAFGSPHVIGISHAAVLAPKLNHPRDRQKVLAEAAELVAEQRRRAEQGLAYLAAAQVVAQLSSKQRGRTKQAARARDVLDGSGRLLLQVSKWPNGAVVLIVPKSRLQDQAGVLTAIERCLAELANTDDKGTRRKGPRDRVE